MNVLLTGEIGVGKTVVCQAMVELIRASGGHPQGLLTPALHDDNGVKVGIEALDVSSGQRWLLAHTQRALDGPRVGRYTFDGAGLDRAIEVLERACDHPSDLLFLDEIGPLELVQGQGFAPVLDRLPLQGTDHVLIVVRMAFLPPLCRRLRRTDFSIYTVTEDNRHILPRYIVRELWPNGTWG